MTYTTIDFYEDLQQDAYHLSCCLNVFATMMLSDNFREAPCAALFDGMYQLLIKASEQADNVQKQVKGLENVTKQLNAENELAAYFKIERLISNDNEFALLIEKQKTSEETSDLLINMLKGVA